MGAAVLGHYRHDSAPLPEPVVSPWLHGTKPRQKVNAPPVIDVMEACETEELPPLAGGVLSQGEELRPVEEKRLLTETGGEKRPWEGVTVHHAHRRPSLPSRYT